MDSVLGIKDENFDKNENAIESEDIDNDTNDFNDDDDGTPKKITDWKNEPTVTDLKQDLSDAKSSSDAQIGKINVWLDNLNITGKAKLPPSKNRSTIVPKLIRKQAEWRYASLSEPFLSTDDLFDVDPVTFEDKKSAIQNSLVLNNQFNTKLDKVKFIDDYIRTAVDEGTVIVRIGWEFLEEDIEVEVSDFEFEVATNPEEIQQIQQFIQLAQEDSEKFQQAPEAIQKSVEMSIQNGVPVIAIQTGSHIEIEQKTVKNNPTIEVCNYKNIVIDPSALGEIDKVGFISYTFESSLSILRKDNRYNNLKFINITGNSILNEPDHNVVDNSSFNFNDKPRKKFVVHEYWGEWDIHKEGKVVPIVASWVGDVMIRLELNPFPDQKVPFVIVQYLPVRRSMYGEPDGELLEDNQRIVGAVTRGMIDIMGRSANGQTGTRKDALDITNKRKFDKGLDYEFNSSVDPRQAFHMHTYPEIPASAQFMLGMQNAEAESLTGVKAFSSGQGITGAALGDNVGGIKSALDAASKRELGILRRLSQGIKQIGRKIISMNAEFMDDVEIIRITNEEFVEVRRDDLAGNNDLRLQISTPEADDAKAKELAFMLQTTGQTMGPEFSQIILTDIARLRKMPDLAKRIEQFESKPDPIAQEKAQLELELLKAQIQNELAKANENNAEAELDKAKISNLNSDTDNKDLNFIEQQTGTTQERILEVHDRQAIHNQDLKITDGAIKERENKFAANSDSNSN